MRPAAGLNPLPCPEVAERNELPGRIGCARDRWGCAMTLSTAYSVVAADERASGRQAFGLLWSASRALAAGVLGCVVVGVFQWWLGLGLLVMWLMVRRYVLTAVLRQVTELRGQTITMRRAWYLIGVGSKVRDAKEVRVFGLADFLADEFRTE